LSGLFRNGGFAVIAGCGLVLAWPWSGAVAQSEPRDWLDRMNYAVEYLNYEGTLVHMYDGRADTLRIVHRVNNGVVSERLASLDGAGREIIRDKDEIKCIFPDEQSVRVEKRKDRDRTQSPLRATLPTYARGLTRHYRFSFGRRARVAGRRAVVLAIKPRDDFRFGYRLWLDETTAMPLKTQLQSERGDVIEQILFASITLPDHIPASALQPSVVMDSFTWYTDDTELDEIPDSLPDSKWAAQTVPDGFILTVAHTEFMAGTTRPIDHIVYTDGLASVSVFVEVAVAASEQAEGPSRIGAANAYTTTRNGHLITAIGEVPARTVESIARSVRGPLDE
jgi:sigma-E factor negative regulatory protein RseB